jgi:hypothetical protein
MPRTTIAEACRQRGINRKDWDEAKRQGIDPWNRKAMDAWQSKRRKRIKPNAKIPPKDPAVTAETIEEMRTALAVATDYDTVKILTEKIKGLQNAAKLQRELRDLIPLAEVEERDIRIGAVVKAGMLKMCNDTAPMAEGLDAAAIHRILMDQGHQVLGMMADEQSEFWTQFA